MLRTLFPVALLLCIETTCCCARPPRPVRLALLSDTHTTRGTAEDQPLYRDHLDQVIAAVNAERVDAVLIAGDLTQGGNAQEIDDFRAQIKGFKAPVLYVFGNHDVGNKRIPGKEGGVTAERVASFEARLGPSFFARDTAGVRIVGLNASLLGSGFPREAEQWNFLEKELARPGGKPTVVFMHYPLFLKSADEPGGDYWNVEPEPRARLLGLLRKAKVKALLTGHLHRPLTNRLDNLLLYTTPPVSFGLPRGEQPEGWTLVTITPDDDVQTDFRPIKH